MIINTRAMDLALAKACMNLSDLRTIGQVSVSSATLAKIRNEPNYDVQTKIVGKIAKALKISVEELTLEEVIR